MSILEYIWIKIIPPKLSENTIRNNEFAIDKCFVISLSFRDDRRQFMTNQLNLESINFEFVDAIDGRDLEQVEIPENIVNTGVLDKLSWGQIGCFLSHENIWAKMLDSDWNHLLVLEDDAVLEREFNIRLNAYFKEVPQDYDFFFIGVSEKGTVRKFYSKHIIIPYNISCMHGYLISRKGCEKALNLISSFPYKKPLDMMLSELIKIRALTVYQSNPILCSQTGGFASNIDPRYFE